MTRRRNIPTAPPWVVLVGAALTVAVAGYGVGWLSLEYFKVPGAPSALWWPAAGLALVIVVRCPRRWWPVLLTVFGVVTVLVNLTLGGLAVAVPYAVVNVLEVLVAAAVLRGGLRRSARRSGGFADDDRSVQRGSGLGVRVRRLGTTLDAARFVSAIGLAIGIGAVIVALRSLIVASDLPWNLVTRGYIITHALGLLAFAPLLLPGSAWWKTGLVRHIEFVTVLGATIAIDVWVFLAPSAAGRAFPVLIPVIWAAIRLDPLRATVISMVSCAIASYGTSRGLGTFAQAADGDQHQLITQLLIATITITTLALVLITRHRAMLAAQASDSEQTLRIAIQQALVGIYSIRLDPGRVGEITDVNTTMCMMLGYEPDELKGQQDTIFRVDPRSSESAALTLRTDQLAAGSIDAFQRETRFVTSSGDELWVEISATRVVPTTELPFALVYVHDLTGREQNKQMLESMALHDALTGLPNRAVLFPRLDDLLQRSYRDDSKVGLLYLDLNGFKPVNDRFGHAAGDAVLVEVARRLENSVRPGDTVARLGGDEFAVLAADIEAEGDMDVITRRIHASLARPITLPDGVDVVIGTSIGAAVGSSQTTADDLVRSADVEMYRAKYGSAPSDHGHSAVRATSYR